MTGYFVSAGVVIIDCIDFATAFASQEGVNCLLVLLFSALHTNLVTELLSLFLNSKLFKTCVAGFLIIKSFYMIDYQGG